MYDDIIDIDYPFDIGHTRMSNYDRCKEFMPFSALVGYKEAVIETARTTSNKIILDEEAKEVLDNKINLIKSKLDLKPIITITYFIPDKTKSGGNYKNISGTINKIDLYKNLIIINNEKISIHHITNIESDILNIDEKWHSKICGSSGSFRIEYHLRTFE